MTATVETAVPAAPLGARIVPGSGRSMREEVHARIRDAILDVRLLPGASLPEYELVDRLGVSRTPIREALQRLANEGLIQVVPQVGTFVARMDLAAIREALFMREALECAALERLAHRVSAEDVAALQAIVSTHRKAVRAGDLKALLAADEAFHRALLALAGMPGLWRYVQQAREMHRRVRVLSRIEYGSARKSVVQHADIAAELAEGRVAQAVQVLRQHIRMNANLAEDLARRYPDYFTAPV